MARKLMLLALGSALALPASASQPGQPLDCSDWVILQAGVSCVTLIPYPCMDDLKCLPSGNGIDNESHGIRLAQQTLNPNCGPPGFNIKRFTVFRVSHDGTATPVAYVDDRCLPDGSADEIAPTGAAFDPMAGMIVVGYGNRSDVRGGGAERYPFAQQKVGLQGLTTTFEILQTYTPATNTLSFRVPYMPEGLAAADHFDTYYGALTNPIDFTQAQPLQCGYPASPPSVGDYLTVADPLPNPAPGSGRYYVTAVSYQGQRRYGRQRVRGVLSGRDPRLLPMCAGKIR
jgi:hypothetical protein